MDTKVIICLYVLYAIFCVFLNYNICVSRSIKETRSWNINRYFGISCFASGITSFLFIMYVIIFNKNDRQPLFIVVNLILNIQVLSIVFVRALFTDMIHESKSYNELFNQAQLFNGRYFNYIKYPHVDLLLESFKLLVNNSTSIDWLRGELFDDNFLKKVNKIYSKKIDSIYEFLLNDNDSKYAILAMIFNQSFVKDEQRVYITLKYGDSLDVEKFKERI